LRRGGDCYDRWHGCERDMDNEVSSLKVLKKKVQSRGGVWENPAGLVGE